MIAFNLPADTESPRTVEDVRQQLREAWQNADAMLSRLSAEVEYHRRSKGNDFEHAWKASAESRGISVSRPSQRQHDWIANGLRVECKLKEGPVVNLLTTPVLGREFLGYCRDDWDVLVLLNGGVMRIIPASILMHDDGHRIRNTIRPAAYPEWIDRWDVFGQGFTAINERQRLMFDGVLA